MIKRILVVNLFGIGDVLFSTPLVRALKKALPDAQIDYMCNSRCGCILKNNKDVENVIIYEKDEFRKDFRRSKIMFMENVISMIKRIRSGNYDLAIDLTLGHQISLYLKLLGIKKRIGFNYRDRGMFLTDRLAISGFHGKHVVEHYLDVLELIGIAEKDKARLSFELSAEDNDWADFFLRERSLDGSTLVGLAPGGGKSWGEYAVYRRWGPENFNYVAKRLAEIRGDIRFLVLGSEEERVLCDCTMRDIQDKAIDLCGELPLVRSTALIKKCSLFICNDGGLLHTAVSQGVNTVSIFGPVDDNIYGPYPRSEKHRVVKAEHINCRPCYSNFKHKPCQTHECLKEIDREAVLREAEESLELVCKAT